MAPASQNRVPAGSEPDGLAGRRAAVGCLLEGGVDRDVAADAGKLDDPRDRPVRVDRQSQNRVAVRSAMTTVTPGAIAAVIRVSTSAALVTSMSPGSVTTTGASGDITLSGMAGPSSRARR